jgi:hypothetical protein
VADLSTTAAHDLFRYLSRFDSRKYTDRVVVFVELLKKNLQLFRDRIKPEGSPTTDTMANTVYKDRLVIVTPKLDEKTGTWTVKIEISHVFNPPDSFSTKEAGEAFGLKFAADYIDNRTK